MNIDYELYLQSPVWQAKRTQRLKIDNFKCASCGRPMDLQVHHIRYPAVLGTENVYSDLITLCKYCHSRIHHPEVTRKLTSRKDLLTEDIRDFVHQCEQEDRSNVGAGEKNYCNLDIAKADAKTFLKDRGYQFADNSPALSRIAATARDYFTKKRYRIINEMIAHNYPPDEIYKRTLFSRHMIKKAFEQPDVVQTILNSKEYSID